MRLKSRRLLSCILLATYAGISILGDGLHALMPEAGHHHHHGLCIVVTHESGNSDRDAALGGNAGQSSEPVVTASDGDIESHICQVCQFLFQSVSQRTDVVAPIDWQPIVVVAVSLALPIYSPASLGPQAPRGPPLLA